MPHLGGQGPERGGPLETFAVPLEFHVLRCTIIAILKPTYCDRGYPKCIAFSSIHRRFNVYRVFAVPRNIITYARIIHAPRHLSKIKTIHDRGFFFKLHTMTRPFEPSCVNVPNIWSVHDYTGPLEFVGKGDSPFSEKCSCLYVSGGRRVRFKYRNCIRENCSLLWNTRATTCVFTRTMTLILYNITHNQIVGTRLQRSRNTSMIMFSGIGRRNRTYG